MGVCDLQGNKKCRIATAMKTNTPYLTGHPHWIDEPEYLDAVKKRKWIDLSFTTAFILVLAIYLAGDGRAFAFSDFKVPTRLASL